MDRSHVDMRASLDPPPNCFTSRSPPGPKSASRRDFIVLERTSPDAGMATAAGASPEMRGFLP